MEYRLPRIGRQGLCGHSIFRRFVRLRQRPYFMRTESIVHFRRAGAALSRISVMEVFHMKKTILSFSFSVLMASLTTTSLFAQAGGGGGGAAGGGGGAAGG